MAGEREQDQAWLGVTAWRRIALFWLLISLAWTPATALTTTDRLVGPAGMLIILAANLIHFAPWALLIPVLLAISRRYPIGLGHTARHGLVFVLIGALVIPLFSTLGVAAGRLLILLLRGLPADMAWSGLQQPILITSLFAIPTFVAVAGIAQTIAYLERFRQRERLLSRTRAEALRAQIAPHFLFNALNAISALGYSEPARADEAMVRLSGLLRQTLERGEWSSLREEIAMVADYVELHRLLLGDRLVFDLDITPGALDAGVPSMLLQPLVENALAHGISRLAGGGMLSLSAQADGQALRITLVNDVGAAEAARAGTGTGLVNVRERLMASYGDRAAFDFALGGGRAVATLVLPREPAPA